MLKLHLFPAIWGFIFCYFALEVIPCTSVWLQTCLALIMEFCLGSMASTFLAGAISRLILKRGPCAQDGSGNEFCTLVKLKSQSEKRSK